MVIKGIFYSLLICIGANLMAQEKSQEDALLLCDLKMTREDYGKNTNIRKEVILEIRAVNGRGDISVRSVDAPLGYWVEIIIPNIGDLIKANEWRYKEEGGLGFNEIELSRITGQLKFKDVLYSSGKGGRLVTANGACKKIEKKF